MNLPSEKIPCIVFAHLGKAKPKHLWLNIERTHAIFPSAEIHFISDRINDIPKQIRKYVRIHQYFRTLEVDLLRKCHSHETKFRHGFWWFSLERILAVGQAHQEIGNRPILHLESDVILMPNFPFEYFTNCQIHWCRYNESKDVGAVLSLPTLIDTNWLMSEIMNKVKANWSHTDMTVLSEISQSNSLKVKVLPTFGTSKIDLRNRKCSLEAIRKLAQLNPDDVNGVFDGATIGMWILGQDPKNYYGITRFRMRNVIDSGDSFVDPSGFTFSYSARDGLRLSNGKEFLKIWNLHVHSKNIKLFGNNWESELLRILEDKELKSEFNWKVFLALIGSNFTQHTLWRFILSIPIFYPIVKSIKDRINRG